jgi:hypothetical protein
MNVMNRLCVLLSLACLIVNTAPCRADDRPASPSLSFWTVGGGDGVRARFGIDLHAVLNQTEGSITARDRLLLALAEAPLTIGQIHEGSGLPEEDIAPLLVELASVHLVRQDDDGRWMTSVPVITDRQMLVIRTDLLPVAREVARYLRQGSDWAKKLYDQVKTPTDPAWANSAHLLYDKFLIDGSFHKFINLLDREQHASEMYSPDQKKIPAFFLERGEHFCTFGTNWYEFNSDQAQREIYVLHGGILGRQSIPMNRFRGNNAFGVMLARIKPDGNLLALTEKEKNMLRALEWVANDRLLVPIIRSATIRSLTPWLEREGRAAAEVFFSEHSLITESYRNSCYARFSEAPGDYIQVCYHILFGLIIEQLVAEGVLPPIPETVPEHFGVYFMFGKS